jgi:hypothetical protein
LVADGQQCAAPCVTTAPNTVDTKRGSAADRLFSRKRPRDSSRVESELPKSGESRLSEFSCNVRSGRWRPQ